jgi:cell surface protein SprA
MLLTVATPDTTLIQYQEIFPNRQLTPFEQSSLRPLDVTFYPRERGPYNFRTSQRI